RDAMHVVADTPAARDHAASLASLRERHQAERAALIKAYRREPRPDSLLIGLRRLMDQLLVQLLAQCPLPAGATLCAVGGYGRGELYPYSDTDILILLPATPDGAAEAAIS